MSLGLGGGPKLARLKGRVLFSEGIFFSARLRISLLYFLYTYTPYLAPNRRNWLVVRKEKEKKSGFGISFGESKNSNNQTLQVMSPGSCGRIELPIMLRGPVHGGK